MSRHRIVSLDSNSDMQSRLNHILQEAREIEEGKTSLDTDASVKRLAYLVSYLVVILYKHVHDDEK